MRRIGFFSFLTLVALLSMVALSPCARAQYPGFDDPGAATGGAPGGGLEAVAPAVDGGAIPIGASSQVVVRFKNNGAQPIETGVINLYPSSNVSSSVSLNQCSTEPLPPGAECAIALSIKGLQAGQWRVEMLMRHSGRARLATATLSGTVEASAEGAEKLSSDIEVIPNEIDFQTLTESQTLVQSVILRNITSNPIDITDMFIDTTAQAGFSLKSECDELAAGQACIATISWSPQLKGPSSGVLVVRHDGPTALASVGLKGVYDPEAVETAEAFPEAVPGKGLLVSSQDAIDFGTGISSASTITVSLVNAGDAPMTIKDVAIAGQDNGLSFKGEGCTAGTVLQPIEACPLTISWSPTRLGALLDDVRVLHDGARGVLVLPVRGAAGAVVSQDQKAIVLTDKPATVIGEKDVAESEGKTPAESYASPDVQNPASVLDGLKITSFAPTRAIVNGPGGSRIMFDGEEVVLGGIPWMVDIQKNGIEFTYQDQRILLLFDKSLSSVNRVSGQSKSGESSGSSSVPAASPAPVSSGLPGES